eukprot:4858331-Ditylum_brightwellii.AAC.1
MMTAEATPLVHPGTILIPGIMHKRNISSHAASMQSLGRCDNDSDDESMSDDGSNYEIDDKAFWTAKQMTKWTQKAMVKKR